MKEDRKALSEKVSLLRISPSESFLGRGSLFPICILTKYRQERKADIINLFTNPWVKALYWSLSYSVPYESADFN